MKMSIAVGFSIHHVPRLGTALVGLASLLVAAGCTVPTEALAPKTPRKAERYEVIVLGIAQDGGLPHVGCQRECCRQARLTGRELYPTSLAIHDRQTGTRVLIDATPRIEAQLALLDRLVGPPAAGRPPVDGVLLTHAHIGHYLGLAHFGREVASTTHLPVYASDRLNEFLRTNGPWSQLVQLEQITPRSFTPGESFSPLPGIQVRAIAVPHRQEYSDTVAFRIRGPHRTVLFVPDIDSWERQPGLLEQLVEDIDVAYLDATWYDGRELPGRDMSEIPHPTMVHTMELLAEQAASNPGRFRFIHLNHTNPALLDQALQEQIEARGFRIAQREERVGL